MSILLDRTRFAGQLSEFECLLYVTFYLNRVHVHGASFPQRTPAADLFLFLETSLLRSMAASVSYSVRYFGSQTMSIKLDANGNIDPSALEKDLRLALDSDVKYRQTDNMKKRAIKVAASYDEFKNMVACAHLKKVRYVVRTYLLV